MTNSINKKWLAATKKQSRSSASSQRCGTLHPPQVADHEADHKAENLTAATHCVVYGLQHRAMQGMLEFDFMCKREIFRIEIVSTFSYMIFSLAMTSIVWKRVRQVSSELT
jgi:hypothetical protein